MRVWGEIEAVRTPDKLSKLKCERPKLKGARTLRRLHRGRLRLRQPQEGKPESKLRRWQPWRPKLLRKQQLKHLQSQPTRQRQWLGRRTKNGSVNSQAVTHAR